MGQKIILGIVLLWLTFFKVKATSYDSLRIEIKNGQPYILHRVESQETLFSLSQRYGCDIKFIKEHNHLSSSNVAVGAVLEIPWQGPLLHQVKRGETLFSISRLYGITVEDLHHWNKLDAHELEVSSMLQVSANSPQKPPKPLPASAHIVRPKETLYSISKAYDITVKQLKSWNNLTGSGVNIGDTLVIESPASRYSDSSSVPEDAHTSEPSKKEKASNSRPLPSSNPSASDVRIKNEAAKLIKENGIAAVFNDDDTQRYLALHRTAPVGTIMQIRNEMTNLSVFVRVVGKLPDTGVNQKVLIRLSKAAQEGLGALDDKFRVELSYIPAR